MRPIEHAQARDVGGRAADEDRASDGEPACSGQMAPSTMSRAVAMQRGQLIDCGRIVADDRVRQPCRSERQWHNVKLEAWNVDGGLRRAAADVDYGERLVWRDARRSHPGRSAALLAHGQDHDVVAGVALTAAISSSVLLRPAQRLRANDHDARRAGRLRDEQQPVQRIDDSLKRVGRNSCRRRRPRRPDRSDRSRRPVARTRPERRAVERRDAFVRQAHGRCCCRYRWRPRQAATSLRARIAVSPFRRTSPHGRIG